MRRDILSKVLRNSKLKDIPILHIVRIIIVILEEEYDYEKRTKGN